MCIQSRSEKFIGQTENQNVNLLEVQLLAILLLFCLSNGSITIKSLLK